MIGSSLVYVCEVMIVRTRLIGAACLLATLALTGCGGADTASVAASTAQDREYPARDAIPARIMYKLETSLPKAPAQVRSFKVNREKVTKEEAEALAGHFGFTGPQAKLVNDNFWAIGQAPDGRSISEAWPSNKAEPGTWLQVFDTRHLFWQTRPAPPPPAKEPAVAWLEEKARAWLQKNSLDAGEGITWKGELNPNSREPGRYPMLLWTPSLDGFPLQTTGAQFSVAEDGTVVYASFPLWRVTPQSAVPVKAPEEAFSELKARVIRLDKKEDHTVVIKRVELAYGDPAAYWPGDVALFYHFEGEDDNHEPFHQYIYAQKDQTGRAPWERP